MIIICCVLWGEKYPNYYVENLKAMVKKHLSIPHEFLCLSDRDLPGIKTIRFGKSSFDFPGWWQKLILFKEIRMPFIYFDLDTLIVDSIDHLIRFTDHQLAMPYVFTPGKLGFQGSVICSNGGFSEPFDDFDSEKFNFKKTKSAPYGSYGDDQIRGDQEYLTAFYSEKIVPIEAGIHSYKISCLDKKPENASVICFHGKPDYHEIKSGWILDHLKSHTEIRTN